ncbi:MAG: multinuclear nonheme iron-dependent oxidase, partial [Limisphaerales bacterium]
ILLAVNNIYVSSFTHNFDPFVYLNNIPADRVAQIHIAGHSKYRKYILDTHDHPVIDPVWKLYACALQLAGKTATLLEWDDHIPSVDEVHHEALKANQFIQQIETVAI